VSTFCDLLDDLNAAVTDRKLCANGTSNTPDRRTDAGRGGRHHGRGLGLDGAEELLEHGHGASVRNKLLLCDNRGAASHE